MSTEQTCSLSYQTAAQQPAWCASQCLIYCYNTRSHSTKQGCYLSTFMRPGTEWEAERSNSAKPQRPWRSWLLPQERGGFQGGSLCLNWREVLSKCFGQWQMKVLPNKTAKNCLYRNTNWHLWGQNASHGALTMQLWLLCSLPCCSCFCSVPEAPHVSYTCRWCEENDGRLQINESQDNDVITL